MPLFRFFLFVCLLSTSLESVYAEIKGAFLIRSERGVQVTVFREASQKLEEGYLLVEGTGTEWDDHPIIVKIIEEGVGRVDYKIEWKNRPYTFLAGRSGSYSLSLPKPFKEFEGLSKPYREEVKPDSSKLEALVLASKNNIKK